jgi:hypothetical protein
MVPPAPHELWPDMQVFVHVGAHAEFGADPAQASVP